MRLSLKIALAVTLMTTCILLLVEWVAAARETAAFESDATQDCRLVAETLAGVLKQVPNLATADERAQALVDAVQREEGSVAVRWVPVESFSALPAGHRNALAQGFEVTSRVSGTGVQERVHVWMPVVQPLAFGPLLSPFQQVAGAVHVSRSLERRDAFVRRSRVRIGLTVALVALASMVLSLGIGRRIVGRRVDALVAMTGRVADGEFLARAPEGGGDELAALGRALNRMGTDLEEARQAARTEVDARIRAEVQLRHVERLTTVGQLAAGVAHELGTPLNVITGRASLVARRVADREEAVSDLRIIQEQAKRITAIIRRLLDFSRRGVPEARPHDLHDVAAETVDLLASTGRKARVDLELVPRGDGPAPIASVDRGQVVQVLSNLVMNAIQAMPSGGRVTLRVTREPCIDGPDHVHLVVEDQGTGIAPDVLPRIFDPFFTTKEPGDGTGLGLSVVHGILQDHGGRIEVESEVGRGTRFTIHLPASRGDEAR